MLVRIISISFGDGAPREGVLLQEAESIYQPRGLEARPEWVERNRTGEPVQETLQTADLFRKRAGPSLLEHIYWCADTLIWSLSRAHERGYFSPMASLPTMEGTLVQTVLRRCLGAVRSSTLWGSPTTRNHRSRVYA